MTEAEEKRRKYMAAYYRRRRAAMTPEQIEAERARRRVENPKRRRGLDEPWRALGVSRSTFYKWPPEQRETLLASPALA